MALKVIKRLCAFDFDGCLMNTPTPEEGISQWEDIKGIKYPNKGWWSYPESLDLDVFDIKPFPIIYKQLIKEKSTPDTHVFILTSRIVKLKPQLQAILNKNNISVDDVVMKDNSLTKGEKILQAIKYMPDLEEISVYDDREVELETYKAIRDKIPENITFNIYVVKDNSFALLGDKLNVRDVINEEIREFIGVVIEYEKINKNNRIYNKIQL